MTHREIERAWTDRVYRASLSDAEFGAIPDHPAGAVELPDDSLIGVNGGTTTVPCTTAGTLTVILSCSINCDTVVSGTCRAGSIGCCSI